MQCIFNIYRMNIGFMQIRKITILENYEKFVMNLLVKLLKQRNSATFPQAEMKDNLKLKALNLGLAAKYVGQANQKGLAE